jgi:hypothetical protein
MIGILLTNTTRFRDVRLLSRWMSPEADPDQVRRYQATLKLADAFSFDSIAHAERWIHRNRSLVPLCFVPTAASIEVPPPPAGPPKPVRVMTDYGPITVQQGDRVLPGFVSTPDAPPPTWKRVPTPRQIARVEKYGRGTPR